MGSTNEATIKDKLRQLRADIVQHK
jgi:hypothetical protein